MAKQIKNVKSIQKKSRKNKASRLSANRFEVVSGGSGKAYAVSHSASGCTCTCKWGQYRPAMDRRSGCSHDVAAYDLMADEAGQERNVSVWGNNDDASRQHRSRKEIAEGVILTAVATVTTEGSGNAAYDGDDLLFAV